MLYRRGVGDNDNEDDNEDDDEDDDGKRARAHA